MSSFRPIITDPLVRDSWRRVIHLWRPMAVWTLLVGFTMGLILAPVTSMILGAGWFRIDDPVISNETLIRWFASPVGLLYLLLAGALGLTSIVIRYAGLFEIVTSDMGGRAHGIRGVVLQVLKSLPVLLRVCLYTMAASLLLLLPVLAGGALLYLVLLGDHDINFYISVQPAEWYIALALFGVWVLAWLMLTLYLAGRSLLALPAILTRDYALVDALRTSWELADSRTFRLLRLMGFAVSGWFLVRITLDLALIFIAGRALNLMMATSIRLAVAGTGLFILLSVIQSVVVGFLGFSFGSTLLTKFYYEGTDLHEKTVPPPRFREVRARLGSYVEPWLDWRRLTPLILVLAGGSLLASGYWLDRLPEYQPVKIIAHRGGPPPLPENTLSAVEHSVEIGVDMVEIDVQITRDGVLVLAHDEDLMRIGRSALQIATSDYEQLKDLVLRPARVEDGGSSSPSSDSRYRIATLPEILELVRGRSRLLIELKSYDGESERLVHEAVQQIREYEMGDQVEIMALDLEMLNQLRQVAPEISSGFVSAFMIGDPRQIEADFLSVNQQGLSPNLLQMGREQHLPIYVWTINRRERLVDMMLSGVGGIITDEPALARRIQEELVQMTTVERLLLRFRRLIIDEESPEGGA